MTVRVHGSALNYVNLRPNSLVNLTWSNVPRHFRWTRDDELSTQLTTLSTQPTTMTTCDATTMTTCDDTTMTTCDVTDSSINYYYIHH